MYDGDHLSDLFSTDEYTYIEDGSAELATGLISLGFIRVVLRRTRWVWWTIAVAAMVAGIAISVKFPPSYDASTSLLLTPLSSPNEIAGAPILNEQVLAQSRAVAGPVVQKLGLHQTISSFIASYTVTAPTDRVLVITTSAKSSAEAVRRASAIATEFMQFRVNLAETTQNLVFQSFSLQVSQAGQQLKALNAQIAQVTAQPTSPAQQAKLKNLQKQSTQQTAALAVLQQANAENTVTSRLTTTGVVKDSEILDPAGPLPSHSHLKRIIEYAIIGLIAGLALSIGIIVISALVSDRLRRRDDVARALGAPVEVSVGAVRSGRRGLAAARGGNVKRIVSYLSSAVPSSPRGLASLAVVPVDDVRVPAACVAALAVSCAQQGLQVVVADLCDGTPAAKLLGATSPGVSTVSVEGAQLAVVVPERDAVVTYGPLSPPSGRVHATEAVVSACSSADLLLTFAALDPSLGGDYLSGWAREAVAMVTAGQSSAARIRAVGEMVRLAGIPLICGVLIGADKSDESLGVAATTETENAAATVKSLRSDANGFFVTADGGPGGKPADD